MATLKIQIGHQCGDDDGTGESGKCYTVGELREAIQTERELLEEIYCLLRGFEAERCVPPTIIGKIHLIYPKLRWKRKLRARTQ